MKSMNERENLEELMGNSSNLKKKLKRSLSVDSFLSLLDEKQKTQRLDQVWADQEEEAAMMDLNFLSLGSRGGDHIHSTMQASSSATTVKERGLPSACVFIAHLEANMSDSILYHALFKLMARYGFILDLQIHRDAKYRPFAFCQFKTPEEADEAIRNASGVILYGRQMRLEKAKVNRTLFISKVERDMTERQIQDLLIVYGPLEEIKMLRDKETGAFKGCLFARFCYREDAIAATYGLETYDWSVEWVSNQNKPPSTSISLEKDSLYLGKLPLEITESDILARFSVYGRITALNLIRKGSLIQQVDRTGIPSKGSNFAFLTFAKAESAAKAVENENGTKWFDKYIEVSFRHSINPSSSPGILKQHDTAISAKNNPTTRSLTIKRYNPRSVPTGASCYSGPYTTIFNPEDFPSL